MKKKKKYLPMYQEWVMTGQMKWSVDTGYTGGLCGSPAAGELLELFAPAPGDDADERWWGHEFEPMKQGGFLHLCHAFTPLRQTILLFMAAMNDEL